MGVVKPFPRFRHRPFVEKHAGNAAYMSRDAGERYLAQQLKVQRDTMTKRGIDPELIEREIRALDSAIRTEIWHIVMASPRTGA